MQGETSLSIDSHEEQEKGRLQEVIFLVLSSTVGQAEIPTSHVQKGLGFREKILLSVINLEFRDIKQECGIFRESLRTFNKARNDYMCMQRDRKGVLSLVRSRLQLTEHTSLEVGKRREWQQGNWEIEGMGRVVRENPGETVCRTQQRQSFRKGQHGLDEDLKHPQMA